MLPTKFTGSSFINPKASLVSSLPFLSSVPFDISATLGFSLLSMALAYALPIRANCASMAGLQSTFAPQSISSTFPPSTVGRSGASAGLEMPLILPILRKEPVSTAPVLPADTIPMHSSSFFTLSRATTSELSFLVLIAVVGTSSLVITSGASTISTRDISTVCSLSRSAISFALPTSTKSKPLFSLSA